MKRKVLRTKRECEEAFDRTPDRDPNVCLKRDQDVESDVKRERARGVEPVVIDLVSDSDDN